MPHIICVGVVYMDTILTVPHFPHEDTKLRATHTIRRRGGNTANTLEVLSQLLPPDNKSTCLSLLTILPDRTAPDSQSVIASLPRVSTDMLLYRTGELSAASCVVIQSEETGSRTVVSANPLEEMSIEEFKDALNSVLLYEQEEEEGRKENQKGEGKGEGEEEVWIHFEGRKPEVLLPCVQWLRNTWGWNGRVRISVECEKPDRVGMKGVAAFADVVVYSRLWAEAHYPNTTTTATSPSPSTTPVSAPSFLTSQTPHTSPSATLLCTWGSHGATLLQKRHSEIETLSSVDAWRPSPDHITQGPVDTVGAGDTFMAGLLYALVVRGWDAERGLGFANQIAGRKVLRRGFGGLGVEMLEGGLS